MSTLAGGALKTGRVPPRAKPRNYEGGFPLRKVAPRNERNEAKLPNAKTKLDVKNTPIEALVPYANNSRTHSDGQVAQIAASIKQFGFTNPVLIDSEGGIIAGHGRVLAARKLGLAAVPTITLGHLSETQRRAYVIADNKLAENAGWDEELLQIELQDLQAAEFDMALLGFSADELADAMGITRELDGQAPAGPDKGIDYKESFAVLVECTDETHQQEVFERLASMGFICKVLVN